MFFVFTDFDYFTKYEMLKITITTFWTAKMIKLFQSPMMKLLDVAMPTTQIDIVLFSIQRNLSTQAIYHIN